MSRCKHSTWKISRIGVPCGTNLNAKWRAAPGEQNADTDKRTEATSTHRTHRTRSRIPKVTLTYDHRTQLIERFRSLLAAKNLNLNAVSKETERIFGASSLYFIPTTFATTWQLKGSVLTICQVFALSKLTGYRFSDFLTLFGFPPDEISRLQLKLHTQRTVLLPSVYL